MKPLPEPRRPEPIVILGRDPELNQLDGFLERAVAYHAPQFVTVVGNQGTGKTRLLAAWASGLAGARVLVGAAVAGVRYSAVAGILRTRAGLEGGADGEPAKLKFREMVSAVFGDRRVAEVVHFLGGFLGFRYAESPFLRAFDDPRQHDAIARALLRHFFELDAAAEPLVLVFDALEAADDDTLSLIEELGDGLAGSAVVLAAAARPELLVRRPRWGHTAGDAAYIELKNLPPAPAAVLFRGLLARCPGLPDALVDKAVARTGGNPGFLEEYVRLLATSGALDPAGTPWKLDVAKALATELPITVEQAIAARIAALEPEDREVLEMAAIFGSVFWLSAIVALLRCESSAGDSGADPWASWDDTATLAARIDALAEKDYLLRLGAGDSTIGDDVEIIFKQTLERDLIYQMIDEERRKRLHRVAAQWLEIKGGKEEHLELLAHLYEGSGDVHRAAGFYVAAADAARARFANPQAVELYRKALLLADADDAVLRLEALHNLGGVLALMGRGAEAEAQFREMLRVAWRFEHPAKGGAAHNRLGRIERQRGDYANALAHFRAARELFERCGDERGVAAVLDDVGSVHWLCGAYDEALERHRQALILRRHLGDKRSIALSLANIGRVHHDSGDFKESMLHFREALELRREVGDRPGVVSSLVDLAAVHLADGKSDQALETLHEALKLAREVGDRLQEAHVLARAGEVLLELGRTKLAVESLTQAEQLAVAVGDRAGQCECACRLAEAALVTGGLAVAEAHAGRALDLAEKLTSRVHLGTAQRVVAEVLAASGDAGADTFFASAIDLHKAVKHDLELARSYRALAAFREKRGDNTEAVRLRMRADEIFGRLRGAAGPHEHRRPS